MCGITGQVLFRKEIHREELAAMNHELAHRGPDDEGFWFTPHGSCPAAGLGHRRLSIIDLSADGHQPMTNEDGTLWIVFNGEIYNFHNLRQDLIAQGHHFHSKTDTETILHLYEEHGTDCLRFLRGMFAFAIWDDKQKRLFAARDRIGKKPFYYAYTGEEFYFASEINSLYRVSVIQQEIDPVALDFYMTFLYIPSPLTIMKGIRKLPPAHYLILNESGLDIKRYWQLTFTPKLQISPEEARQALLEKVTEATRIRLFSDVPIGCFLSGGVDSSLVVATMAKLNSAPVKTFSIGFGDRAFDETPYARQVAEQYHTDHIEFEVRPVAVEVLPEIVRHYGEPFGDASALPTWYLARMARQHVTVALNGDGGDELFAGYNWYVTAHMLSLLARFLPASVCRALTRRLDPWLANKLRRTFELLAQAPGARFADLRMQLRPALKQTLYSAQFLSQIDKHCAQTVAQLYDGAPANEAIDRMLNADSCSYLPEELLVKVDRATMAHSLEARSPLLDHELMEFAARLPTAYKLRWGKKKYLLRQISSVMFSPGFLDRPKAGFSVPLRRWFQEDLATYAEHSILQGKLAASGLFRAEGVLHVFGEHRAGHQDHGDLIWRLLVLALWFEFFR
jgi:asparagine synthase (glutamine-hydrolysing)